MPRFVHHTVIDGDTIQAIAQRYLEDAERWTEIVELNKLRHPYVVGHKREPDTDKNVRAIGETVIVPVEDETQLIDSLTPYQIRQGLDNVFGEDLAVFDFGGVSDLMDATANIRGNNKGDLSTVKGLANLRQAILMRLIIEEGSLYHHPDYGTRFHKYLGGKRTYENLQKLKIELERTVRDDPRVKEVTVSDIRTVDSSVVAVNIDIQPIGLEETISLGLRLDEEGVIEWG